MKPEKVNCSICDIRNIEDKNKNLEIYRDDLWLLRHHPKPSPLLGWLILDSIRHISGPIEFNPIEAQSWGEVIQQTSKLIKKLTKCHRIYTIAFGENAKHLHLHLIPRIENHSDTKSWAISDHYREVEMGSKKAADPSEIDNLIKEARIFFL